LALGADPFQLFYTQYGLFRPKKKAQCKKQKAKRAQKKRHKPFWAFYILRKFQTAVPPKVFGIRENP
jgi:hypothetical protein